MVLDKKMWYNMKDLKVEGVGMINITKVKKNLKNMYQNLIVIKEE